MNDALLTFLSQACYYDFECRVFALPDGELTRENLNAIFLLEAYASGGSPALSVGPSHPSPPPPP